MARTDAPPVFALPPIAVGETLQGRPGIVDLWCFPYEEEGTLDRPDLRDAYAALMTPDEQARHDRYVFDRDRRLFLATRALVRCVLSQYAAVDPAAWRFAAAQHGRPYIEAPRSAAHLHFNLSNTRGMVVCAVSLAHPQVGVDTEAIDRRTETVTIADHYFSPLEVQALHAVPAAGQTERFFAYWTLKESYIKARGLGLALPLEQFSFLLDDGPEIGIAFAPQLGDDASRWRFALLRGSSRHFIAVGVDTGGTALSLRARRLIPLHSAPTRSGP